MRRPWCAFFAVLVVSLTTFTVAACGDSDSSSTDSSSSDSSSAKKTIQQLDVVRGPIETLDLTKEFSTDGSTMASLVAEGLMQITDDGKLKPRLAKTVENPDPVTYVYTLDDKATFSNGSPVTVEDVVFSLKRNMAPTSQTASNYEDVKSVSARGTAQIEVKLKAPSALWQYVPALYGGIFEKKSTVAAGDAFGSPKAPPIGTGPFRVERFARDRGIEFAANENWWQGKPHVKNVSVKFVSDAATVALAMRSGEADVALPYDPTPFRNIDNVDLLFSEPVSPTVFSMNVTKDPWDDLNVRKAVAYAIDRDGIVKSVVGDAGKPLPALAPEPVWANVASQEEVDDLYGSLPELTYDVEKAKEALAASDHPDGFSTSLRVSTVDPLSQKIAQAMKSNLAEIGIDMKITAVPDNQWFAEFYGPRDELGLFLIQISSAVPDPYQNLSRMLGSANAAKDTCCNTASFKDSDVDRLLDEAGSTDVAGERFGPMSEVLTIAQQQLPYLPIYAGSVLMVVSDNYEYENFGAWYFVQPWPLALTSKS